MDVDLTLDEATARDLRDYLVELGELKPRGPRSRTWIEAARNALGRSSNG